MATINAIDLCEIRVARIADLAKGSPENRRFGLLTKQCFILLGLIEFKAGVVFAERADAIQLLRSSGTLTDVEIAERYPDYTAG